jgi:cobalt-zinc-cadmium efflux system outer membrane protein
MFSHFPSCRWGLLLLPVGVTWLLAGASVVCAQDGLTLPPLTAKVLPPTLSREDLVRWALQNHPELATIRQQRGIAAAGVVIARTYPFNPIVESRVEGANGPGSAGVNNVVLNEHKILTEVELRGQRGFRQQIATAALTRTEWEIAFQEVLFVARVLRTFDGVLYRQEKVRLANQRILLNEAAAERIRKLREQGKLSPADPFLIRNEIDDARAQRAGAEVALATADFDLRRAVGTAQEGLLVAGTIEGPPFLAEPEALVAHALDFRADLRARQAAVAEAEARVRFEVSNRFGNPTLGPSCGVDPTQIFSIGMTFTLPLPVFNAHRGDILQRQAEQMRAVLDLRQTEVLVQQDVLSALARMQRARSWLDTYQKQVLPNLRNSLEVVEKLFAAADPGVDVLRVLDARRSLLKAQDAYLDALWEYSQARADLVAAVGDLELALGPDAIACLPRPQCPR